MDDLRLGALVRTLRRRLGWRQVDLARRAGVSQSAVSRLETGHLDELSLSTIRRIAAALEITVDFAPRWRGGELARLLDEGHAQLVKVAVRDLRAATWDVTVEYTFNHYGDRGGVDVLGWHPATRTLLLVEVKTRLVDIQGLLGSMDRKRRVVPALIGAERGWRPAAVARVLFVADTTANRDAVSRHAATFGAALPGRAAAIRGWIAAPSGALSGIWFRGMPVAGGKRRAPAARRIRVPSHGGDTLH